jgi:KaiC/GvpD/RAD55 family RecA-like ATPase
MIRSGSAPLDAQLGGVIPGRLHLLTGGPGTGKSKACLQFLGTGLRRGEPVGLVTLDRLTDLASHARSTGLDLDGPLRTGQLLLLRFRGEFPRLLDSAGLPGLVVEDLRRLIADARPTRLVVDPLTPFLADGTSSGSALAALAQFLDELGATTIVTYPRDVTDGSDARLDSIVQKAGAIVHLVRRGGGAIRTQVVQARVPLTSALARPTPGLGLVTIDRETQAAELDGARRTGARKRIRRAEAST